MKIRSLVCIVVIVVVGVYLNSAKATVRPLGESIEVVEVRQQLQRALDALKVKPDYLTYIDIAELQALTDAIASYVRMVDKTELASLQAQAQKKYINAGDLTDYKHLLDKISEILKLEPEVGLYFGATIEARD